MVHGTGSEANETYFFVPPSDRRRHRHLSHFQLLAAGYLRPLVSICILAVFSRGKNRARCFGIISTPDNRRNVEKDTPTFQQITFKCVEEIAGLSARRARPSAISSAVDGSFNLVPAESLIVCKLVCNSSKCVHSTVRSDAWPFNPFSWKVTT